MRDKIIEYLEENSPFSRRECENIADEIDGTESVGYIQEVLLKYMGGYDDYAYETTWTLAGGIKNL